ncbi:MAG TPA: CHASE3 domain-containing protein, partial [Janthinobacterium sp.]|nr:CHASE3 domain-containing protein [Janthinobacterium sp.]
MLKDLRIKNKLAAGFGAIVAIILMLLALAWANFSRLSEASAWDRHTLEVILEANRTEITVVQIQNATRGFVLTGEESIAAPIQRDEEFMRKQLAQLVLLTADNPVQQERLKRLGPIFDGWLLNNIHSLLDKRRALNQKAGVTQPVAATADVLNGTRVIAEGRKLIADISAEENRLLALRSRESEELQQSMRRLLAGGGLVCVVLAVLIGYLLSRSLLAPLNKLTEAVGKIAAGQQSARAQVLSGDELGQVTVEFNRMAQAIQDSQANELAATNLLKAKVDALLDVVSKAASGDLTGKVTIGGGDAIGQLGNGLAKMFDNLRALLNNV